MPLLSQPLEYITAKRLSCQAPIHKTCKKLCSHSLCPAHFCWRDIVYTRHALLFVPKARLGRRGIVYTRRVHLLGRAALFTCCASFWAIARSFHSKRTICSPASTAAFFWPTVGSDGSGGRRTLTALPSPRRSVRSLEETLLEMANMDISPLPKLIAEVLPYR